MQTSFDSAARAAIRSRLDEARRREALAIVSELCDGGMAFGSGATKRFTVDGDTVHDARTGLIWSRATLSGGRRNWKDAQKAAAACTLGGFSDWRLPTVQELLSIVDYERPEPAIDPVFECAHTWYWTSTPLASSPSDYAWVVNFSFGNSYWGGRGNEGFVRAVRSVSADNTGERR